MTFFRGPLKDIPGSLLPSLRLAPLPIAIFICGALAPIKINLVGEIFAVEIALIFLAIVAIASGAAQRLTRSALFWLILAAGVVTLFGYIVSDMVRGTPPEQFMRGWARNAIVLSSFVSLALLFSTDRRNAWWFIAGLAIGSFAYFKFVQRLPIGSVHDWKFSYAGITALAVACMAAIFPARLVALALVGVGVYSVTKDARIIGVLCILTALMVLFASKSTGVKISTATLTKMAVAAAIGVVAGILMVQYTSNDYTDNRRESSNVNRAMSIKNGFNAIRNSPVVGYGSWSRHPDLIRISRETIAAHEAETGAPHSMRDQTFFSAHSQIIDAWIEGGMFGAALCLTTLCVVGWASKVVLVERPLDYLTPVLVFTFSLVAWNLLASPLGSSTRVYLALSLALAVMVVAERRARTRTLSGQSTSVRSAERHFGRGRQIAYRRRGQPIGVQPRN